jgi:hypothetical protein
MHVIIEARSLTFGGNTTQRRKYLFQSRTKAWHCGLSGALQGTLPLRLCVRSEQDEITVATLEIA